MLFMILTAGIVLAGVKNGIEKYTKILMPLLVVLVIAVCVRSVTLPNAGKGLEYLFYPNWSGVTWSGVLTALGQAAFSLSIGMGCLITYGSYIKKDNNLLSTSFQVASADTLIAILAGVMIFPVESCVWIGNLTRALRLEKSHMIDFARKAGPVVR